VAGTAAVRGVWNLVEQTPPARLEAGLVTVWLGRHAPAVLHVALALGVPVTAYMAHRLVRPEAIAKFRSRGGKIVVAGETLQEAARLARRRAEREGAVFVDPFADPAFINGCATSGLELFESTPLPSLLVLPAWPSCGLGMLGALALVAKTLSPGVRVVGVEFAELPLLERASREYAGKPVTFIGVDASDVRATASRTVCDVGITYPTVFDPKGTSGGIASSWQVAALPQTWFIARDGTRSSRIPHALSAADLHARVDQLLAAG
jgi:threonine dehydratase